jgi:hypothetical protein
MFYQRPIRYFVVFCAFNFLGLANGVFAEALATGRLTTSGLTSASTMLNLDVYKSETCPCCEKWILNLESKGFLATAHHPADLHQEKVKRGIAPRYHSCHTAVSADGYVFEGHIPASVIQRFLTEKPKGAIGLAVPGMPMGSPGMEMGNHFNPYDVLLLKADGSSAVYAQITSIDQQY